MTLDKIIQFKPIGIIHTPFKEPVNVPIQPSAGKGIKGTVTVDERLTEGLQDLEGFSYIYLIYYLHLSQGYSLKVKPFLDDTPRGLFATRAPRRPNPIGLSIVKLIKVQGNVLHIEDIDIVDNTPLLDIKPYSPQFDHRNSKRCGWLRGKDEEAKKKLSDDRFTGSKDHLADSAMDS